jgi:CheY-like chemotaxis protein
LVVDGTSDTEAVLKAVLEPRGAHVERTRGMNARQRVVDQSIPQVVVIDLDDESADKTANCFCESRRILIGSEQAAVTDRDRFLAKPFQYPELLQAIEDLLSLPPAA